MTDIKIAAEIGGKITSARISIPSKWDEVPPHLYPMLSDIYLAEPEKLNKYDKTYRAFLLFCSDQRGAVKLVNRLTPEEVYDLLPTVDWVFRELDLQKNLVGRIWCKPLQLFGPEDGLKNMRFGEWVVADTCYADYCRSQDEGELNKLIASIYRPQGKGDEYKSSSASYRGDIREKFNDALLDQRAALVATLPIYLRRSIWLWFGSCKWQLRKTYKEIFEGDGDEEQSSALSGYGWFGIYDDLRGDPRYGSASQLEEEFIHTVFQSLVRSHYKMKELKKQYRS